MKRIFFEISYRLAYDYQKETEICQRDLENSRKEFNKLKKMNDQEMENL